MRPPRQQHPVTTIVMPPERHISVPKDELRLALKNRVEVADRPKFDDLAKLLEGVAAFDFVDLKQRMRASFRPCGSGAVDLAALERVKGAPITDEDLDAMVGRHESGCM